MGLRSSPVLVVSADGLQKAKADFDSLCMRGKLAKAPKKGPLHFDLGDGRQVRASAGAQRTRLLTRYSAVAVLIHWVLRYPTGIVMQETVTFSEALLRLLSSMAVPELDPAQVEPPRKRRTIADHDRDEQKQQQLMVLNSDSFRLKLRHFGVDALFEQFKKTRSSTPYLVHLSARKDDAKKGAWQKVFFEKSNRGWWELFHPAGRRVLVFVMCAIHGA
jgi:hypothetical protein